MRSAWIVFFCIIALVTSSVAMAAECSIVVDDYDIEMNDTIQVQIRVEDGVDIGAIDLNITFNSSILSAESADDGGFDNTVINLEDADNGRINVVAYQGGNTGINGNFTVCIITFEALETGENNIDLEVATLTDASPECTSLNYAVRDGRVTINETTFEGESDTAYQQPSGGVGGGSSGSGWWYTTPTPTPQKDDDNEGGLGKVTPTTTTTAPPSSAGFDVVEEPSQPENTISWVMVVVAISSLLMIIIGVMVYAQSKKR